MSKVVELFAFPVIQDNLNWRKIVKGQFCPYVQKRCYKVRKSDPTVSIGTCVVAYGKQSENIIICPHRLLQNNQIFFDCIHLLTRHQPENELHVVSEVSMPGGNIDYFLVSTDSNRKIIDFVGVELQTMDTIGSIWPEREMVLYDKGIISNKPSINKTFGMNWKMTAKTILVQLHHKIQTFQSINKHLVLVVQKPLLDYIKREFSFSHVSTEARLGDSMQIHSYSYVRADESYKIKLEHRYSTDSAGISALLGLNDNPNVELEKIVSILESKISDSTILSFGH